MIGANGRYAAEVWFGDRQAAEIWLGSQLVWSGHRVPMRVLVDLGLISRAQVLAALGKAGVSEAELQLIASALALGEPGIAGSVQNEALAVCGLADGEAGRDSGAVLRLDAAQADGGAALPGVLFWQGAVRLDPDAEPESAAGHSAVKAAKLEEKAADAEFGAGKSAEKAARLDKPFVLPKAGLGGDVQAEKRLDAERAAGAFGAGHKAERMARLDGLLADGRAGAERKAEMEKALEVLYGAGAFGAGFAAEKSVQISRIADKAAFGHGSAGKKTDRLEVLTASGRHGAERKAEMKKALWVLYSDGAFGHGFAARKSWKIFRFAAMAKRGIGHCVQKTASIFSDSALARRGAGRKSRKQAVLEFAEGALAGLAGAKSAANAVLEKSAAQMQRSGQIFAKVQREGLNLATKAKIRPEKQMQALAKLAARARAGLLGALGRKARIQNEAGMRANALAAKSGGGLLYAGVRTKPAALAMPIAILPKQLQGAAKAGLSALAMPEKTDGEHLRGVMKMAYAEAMPQSVSGSRMQALRSAERARGVLDKDGNSALQGAVRAENAYTGMTAAKARAGRAHGAVLRAVCALGVEKAPESGWVNRQTGHILEIFGAWGLNQTGSVLDFGGAEIRQAGSCLEIGSLAQMQKRGSVLTLGSSEAVLEEADAVQNGRVLEVLGVNEAALTAVFAAVQKNNILEVE